MANVPFNVVVWRLGSGNWFSTYSAAATLPGWDPGIPDATISAGIPGQDITVSLNGSASVLSLSMQAAGVGLSDHSATLAMSGGSLGMLRASPVGNVVQTAGAITFTNGLSKDVFNQPPITDTLHPGVAGATSAIWNLTQSAGAVVTIVSGRLELQGGASVIAGTINGKGSLADPVAGHVELFVSGTATLAATAVIDVSELIVAGPGATLILGSDRSYGDVFTQAGQTLLQLAGHTLTLTGTTALHGAVVGPGHLALTGSAEVSGLILTDGAVFDIAGTATQGLASGAGATIGTGSGATLKAGTLHVQAGGSWTLAADSGAVLSAAGTITNEGLWRKSGGTGVSVIAGGTVNSTGTIQVESGTLQIVSGTGALDGHLTGAGELAVGGDGGSYQLAAGVVLDVARFTTGGTGAHLTLQGDLAYAGSYKQGGVSQLLDLDGHQMTLSGTADIFGAVTGPGRMVLSGTTTMRGTTFGGGVVLENKGSVTQTTGFFSSFVLGATAADSATLLNGRRGSWAFATDISIELRGGTSVLDNAGTVVKSGGLGQSFIAGGSVTNSGTIAAASGTLAITSALANTGTLVADGARLDIQSAVSGVGAARIDDHGVLEFRNAVAATQSVAFGAGIGTLELALPGSFGGSISGFGTGDVIHLLNRTVTGVTWDGTTLSLTYAGAIPQSFALSGNAPGIVRQSDNHGGTELIGAATGPVTLTADADVVFFASGTNTVFTTAKALNADDRLGGGSGLDSLVLTTGGTFDLAALAQFTGFEQVSLADATTTLVLRAGAPLAVTGGTANDTFRAGTGAFTAAHAIDGGGGSNTLLLDGDYASGVVFGAATLTQVQAIRLAAGHDYALTTHDGTVAPGAQLEIDASLLGPADSLTFDGKAETDGRFLVRAGAGADSVRGGAGADRVLGVGVGDSVFGGSGKDSIEVVGAPALIDGGGAADMLRVLASMSFASGSVVNVETALVADGVSADFSALSGGMKIRSLSAAGGPGVVIEGTSGNDKIYAGAGPDRLVFAPGHGDDTVYKFQAGPAGDDALSLPGLATSFAEVLAHATVVGGKDLLISFGADSILLKGVTALDSGDVLFA